MLLLNLKQQSLEHHVARIVDELRDDTSGVVIDDGSLVDKLDLTLTDELFDGAVEADRCDVVADAKRLRMLEQRSDFGRLEVQIRAHIITRGYHFFFEKEKEFKKKTSKRAREK